MCMFDVNFHRNKSYNTAFLKNQFFGHFFFSIKIVRGDPFKKKKNLFSIKNLQIFENIIFTQQRQKKKKKKYDLSFIQNKH